MILEQVGHGIELDVGSGVDAVLGGASASAATGTAAAYQPDTNHIAAGRVDVGRHGQLRVQSRSHHGRGRCFQKLAAIRHLVLIGSRFGSHDYSPWDADRGVYPTYRKLCLLFPPTLSYHPNT